jgi:peptidyl-dipeptidase Dcp
VTRATDHHILSCINHHIIDIYVQLGDIFDPTIAARLRQFIYSTGNSIEPGQAFRSFRGRDPVVEPMLKKKSLL